MKKKFFSYTLLLMLINLALLSVSAQKKVPVDVSSITSGTLITKPVDFSKNFTVIFENNKTGPNVKIEIRLADTFKLLKKGVLSSAESIEFDFISDGRDFSVKHSGDEPISFSPIDSIVLRYTNNGNIIKQVRLLNKPESGDNVGVNNNNNNNSETPKEHVTGIELHDAILARKYYENRNPDLFRLMARIKNSDERDPKKIIALYSGNDYIIKLLQDTIVAKFDDSSTKAQAGFLGGLAGKVLNTDVTTFADGLARFLVKRTKEELNVAFFQRFTDLINRDEYKDAKILFPMTMETLNTIDKEIYQFENYITTLREAFEKDLSLLLENLPRVIEEGNWSSYFSKRENTNLKYSLLLTFFIARELLDGAHPGKVLENLPEEFIYEFVKSDDSTQNRNISGTFKTAQLLSASLRSRDSDRYWSSTDSIQMLYKNDPKLIAAKFYLGFLYEKAKVIEFQNDTLSNYLTQISRAESSIMEYILFIKELGRKYHAIESAIVQIKIKSPETPSIDIYNRLFKSFSDAFEDMLEIGELPAINVDTMIAKKVKQYIKLLREGNDLALNVVRKNYGSAVVNTYNIYMTFAEKLSLNEDEKEIANKVKEFIKKYGTFMANTVKAKTSEEVAAAIEAVALPVGSASIKRQTDFNISLNAYVGLFLGSENIKGVDDGWKLNSYGVTAPIGIAVSFRNSRHSSRRSSSSSIFFSIIDLGAPVSFRFKDDKTEEIPSIQFKDIISPGVFYSFGIPRAPISVNAGWQLGPLLRVIDDPTYIPTGNETYSRISLSIVVDIPLLNFYTRNR